MRPTTAWPAQHLCLRPHDPIVLPRIHASVPNARVHLDQRFKRCWAANLPGKAPDLERSLQPRNIANLFIDPTHHNLNDSAPPGIRDGSSVRLSVDNIGRSGRHWRPLSNVTEAQIRAWEL